MEEKDELEARPTFSELQLSHLNLKPSLKLNLTPMLTLGMASLYRKTDRLGARGEPC